MQVLFWGARGSLPASVNHTTIRGKITRALKKSLDYKLTNEAEIEAFIDNNLTFDIKGGYGCNTSCVEIKSGEEYVICDSGSGLRDFGTAQIQKGIMAATYHIFISHLHWDHINGFPFFTPAYIPGNKVHVYGFHKQLESAFINQQEPPGFPLPLNQMGGTIEFHVLNHGEEKKITGLHIKGIAQKHPGASWGYSFEKDGKKVIYSTDSEHQAEADKEDYPFIEFSKNADLLIFDAQYNLADHYLTKKSWGHSSNLVGVELAVRSNAKHLCLFHHEHTVSDAELEKFLADTRRYLEIYNDEYPLRIDLAYEGMEITL